MKNKLSNIVYSQYFVFFAVVAFVFARAPFRIIHGYLWAEDASVFIKQSYEFGWYSLFKPYAGYIHLLSRVIANFACMVVDVVYLPYLLSSISLLIMGFSCCYLFNALRNFSSGVAIMVAFSPVVTPQNGELLLTITNLQWVLCPVILIMLWECSVGEFDFSNLLVRGFILSVLTLTGPFGVFFFPFWVVFFVVNGLWRVSKSYIWVLPYFISVSFQLWVIFNYPQKSTSLIGDHFLLTFLVQYFSDLCSFSVIHGHNHIYLNVVLGVCFFAMMIWSGWLAECRYIALLFYIFSFMLWLIGMFRVGNLTMHLSWRADGSRYLYLPLLFMLWANIFTYHYSISRLAKNVSGFIILLIFVVSMTKFSLNEWPDWVVVKRAQGTYIMVPMSDGVYIKREFL
ncbi:hypothetical protein EAY64_07815 [Aquitalea palustris]|uniref:EpsG family protein n=1 Tax=Aquitalea palustris TaxID=2480983 RepID=A0A454JJV1_9NEIS|nr:hypothetical protein [Aquitalea palustris]RMC99267.1 hypothetical protein EAY64_07815 [Aquitalea palustris]